jgi:hypothetical protein
MTDAASTESRTFESAETLAHDVAEWLCGLARASDRVFAVCLSGGSTPRRLYESLADPALRRAFHGTVRTGSGATNGSCRTTIPTAIIGWRATPSFRESRSR